MIYAALSFVIREVFLALLWTCVASFVLGGVFRYVILTTIDSGKELVDYYFVRKEEHLRRIGGYWPSSGSKNVN